MEEDGGRMEGTEEDGHRRVWAAGVPLVMLALPRPLGWGGSLIMPFRVMQGDLSSLGVDMFNIGNLERDGDRQKELMYSEYIHNRV